MAARLNQATARLLDANLNRAREGLRVVEDTVRFLWDDPAFYRRLRSLRHRLHFLTAERYKELLKARESVFDVGRGVVESPRASLQSLVAANMRRAQEATRVLEEYSKVFSPKASSAFKEIRYQLYEEEKKLAQRLSA